MRVMAVDYGDARTGIAVSDLTQTLAGEAWVIKSKKMQETAQMIADEAAGRDVSCIVIGYPKNMDGTIGERALMSEDLAEAIRALCGVRGLEGIQIKLWDERLTTMSAHRILSETGARGKKRKNTVDAVAAALILEGYLGSLQ